MPDSPFDPLQLPPRLAAYLLRATPAERDRASGEWAGRALAAVRLMAAADECLAAKARHADCRAGELADRLEELARELWDYDPTLDTPEARP